LTDVVFENHVENRWVMARWNLDEGQETRALLERLIELIETETAD